MNNKIKIKTKIIKKIKINKFSLVKNNKILVFGFSFIEKLVALE